MAVVTSDFLAGLMTNFRAIFGVSLADFDKEVGLYKEIATTFPSTSDKESYGWLGEAPRMAEWRDERRVWGLGAFDYTLTNKHYEATIAVNRDTLEDDKYGLITPRIRGLARRAVLFLNEMVFSQLDDGAVGLAYDGGAFFADTRVIGASANIDNLLAGDYGDTGDKIRAALRLSVAAMRNFQDDRGVPMNLVPDIIICSPAKEMIIREALLPAVAGTQRPEAGLFNQERIIATPWVDANANHYFLLCTGAEVKPIILQDRKRAELTSLDQPTSEEAFKRNLFLYGVDMRFGLGYGDPRTAIKVASST